jgi:nucleotide-binding universal stress UspA family protein
MSRERRRILIGLDSSPGSLRGLAEAAAMAARLDAELVGLFVEDDNLLRLARLPQSYEIGLQSARSRHLDPEAIARLFKQMAERARLAVKQAAERERVRSSFAVARGSVIGQLLRALSGAGEGSLERSRPQRFGSGEGAPSIILMQGQVCVFPAGKAVIVLGDEHFSANRLPVALDLADESATEELLFVVVSNSLINARRQVARVAEFLELEGRTAQIKILSTLETDFFLALLENESCGTLIFSACPKLTDRETLLELSETIDYPIFLVGR